MKENLLFISQYFTKQISHLLIGYDFTINHVKHFIHETKPNKQPANLNIFSQFKQYPTQHNNFHKTQLH